MRKFIEILKRKDVGAIGIGAMIVFIAMVLVAGIAASVLIQTSTSLQSQALTTGQDTIDEVSTGLAVVDIVGKVHDDIRDIAITVSPRAGTPDIDLNETIILISDGSVKALLTYYGWFDGDLHNTSVNDSGRLFLGLQHYANSSGAKRGTLNWSNLTNDYYGIIVLSDADSSCTAASPIINKGDKVALCIRCGASELFTDEIDERTDVYGRVIPEVGSPGIISFTTPASYNDVIYDLQ